MPAALVQTVPVDVGVLALALSGALTAVRRGFDAVGIAALRLTAAWRGWGAPVPRVRG